MKKEAEESRKIITRGQMRRIFFLEKNIKKEQLAQMKNNEEPVRSNEWQWKAKAKQEQWRTKEQSEKLPTKENMMIDEEQWRTKNKNKNKEEQK